MKKLLWLGFPALMLMSSCVDGLDDNYNKNPKQATQVPGVTLMSSAQRSLARAFVSTSVNLNPFRLWVQQLAETTYPDETRLDFVTRQINNAFWNTLYRDVLRDLQESKKTISANALLSEGGKGAQTGAIEVQEVLAWSTLVDNFGDIPYSEALDYNKPRPKYDDDKAIYDDLIKRLDAAIVNLNKEDAELGDDFASGDLIYHGDLDKWQRFANSLKLRLALTIADADQAQATAMVNQLTAAGAMYISSNDENASLVFDKTSPNTNPLWEDLVQSGRTDFIATDFFLKALNNGTAMPDPRLDDYFNEVKGVGGYKGGISGNPHNFVFSLPGDKLRDQQFPGTLMSYTETEFLLAEAAARGLNVDGTAAEHYKAGIIASITEWGNSEAEAEAYALLHPYTAGAGFTEAAKEQIGTQKWIALYNQPVEAWKEYRRLDYPKLTLPVNAVLTAIPKRYTYPIPEQNLNTTNYNAAKSAIGGDETTTAIFWDKF